jgi:hypothetical protein
MRDITTIFVIFTLTIIPTLDTKLVISNTDIVTNKYYIEIFKANHMPSDLSNLVI